MFLWLLVQGINRSYAKTSLLLYYVFFPRVEKTLVSVLETGVLDD